MTVKYCCEWCGYVFERELDARAIRFAWEMSSKTLAEIWVCPRCENDNTTEVEIPG